MFKDFFNLNSPLFWTIIEKFLINLGFLFLLIRIVYYRYSKKGIYVFSLFLMGIVIFILGSMLPIVFNSDLLGGGQLGMAVGLFAIFTILRFRTRNLNVKDMAYFFTVIAISAVNSFTWKNFPILGIFIFNSIIICSAFVSEILLARIARKNRKDKKGKKIKYSTHPIIYDNLEMLKPQNKEELIKNVAEISGLDVKKVRIKKVDYKEKTAILDIYY